MIVFYVLPWPKITRAYFFVGPAPLFSCYPPRACEIDLAIATEGEAPYKKYIKQRSILVTYGASHNDDTAAL